MAKGTHLYQGLHSVQVLRSMPTGQRPSYLLHARRARARLAGTQSVRDGAQSARMRGTARAARRGAHQVVAGLVQQQDVRLLEGDARERDARLLPPAQRVHRLQRQLAAHAERAQVRAARRPRARLGYGRVA